MLFFTFQTNYPNYHSCFYSTHSSYVTCKILVLFDFLIFPIFSSVFWNFNSYAFTAFLFLPMFTKCPRVIAMITCSLTEVPQRFVSSFSSTLSGTQSYHFSFRSNSHFPDSSQGTPPAPSSCLLLYYFCFRQFRARANNMANCLVTLLAHYYRYWFL